MNTNQNLAQGCPGNDLSAVQPGTFSEPAADGSVHLIGAQCRDCGQLVFPARMRCVRCYGGSLSEATLARRGSVASFSSVRQAPPGYWGEVPYTLGMVELEDGVSVLAHLVGQPAENWKPGAAVESCALPVPLGGSEQCNGTSFAFRPTSIGSAS